MDPDTDRIARMKTLGEALDHARSRADELRALLSEGIAHSKTPSPEHDPPARADRPVPGDPPTSR